jgi:hypothetical protein
MALLRTFTIGGGALGLALDFAVVTGTLAVLVAIATRLYPTLVRRAAASTPDATCSVTGDRGVDLARRVHRGADTARSLRVGHQVARRWPPPASARFVKSG